MTHRQRVLQALRHQQPDRVPIDLAGTFASTITLGGYERLKEYLRIEKETIVMSKRSQVAQPHEEVLRYFDIDTRGIQPRGPAGWVDRLFPDGSYQDEWGVIRSRPPGGGHFYVSGPPFAGEPSVEDIRKHPWPDPFDPGFVEGIAGEAQRLHQETDFAVVLNLPVGFVHQAQFLRGYEEWLTDLLLHPVFAEALMDKVLEIQRIIGERMIEAGNGHFDLLFYGDDLAFQGGPMMSLELYRKMIKPRHRQLFSHLKSKARVPLVFHSCGSVYPLLEDLIEIGVDCINPVQVSAKDMDTRRLKEEFGDRMAFWGAIDTHRVLPFGTPEEVRAEVKRRIEDLAPGGGYILNSVHNLQPEVPPENIMAMFEAAKEFGKY
ncbi:MAG: uroporphyrinogen decarboxylase family protein [candidate division NC10 bacterium]|nr:uroporphyrinogen decarboxylase family protein [candidate division NC10 bacterium]